MKILYSPEFNGRIFLGQHDNKTVLMDVTVCDTMGLISLLGLRLGTHYEERSVRYRAVMYYKAMSDFMKRNPGNALEDSFNLSGLGTAEQALAWRDNLVLDRWNSATADAISGRLAAIAGIEPLFDCPGMADRLVALIDILQHQKGLFPDIEIELPCPLDLLHPTVVELMQALQRQGVSLTVRNHGAASTNSNLSRVADLLRTSTDKKIRLDKDDSSFMVYRFSDEKAANEYIALKGDELNANLWINSDSKSLDNWMRMMGKPTIGSSMADAIPPIIQLFVLGVGMLKEPIDINSLTGWLYSPMQPFGNFFGGILAETIISSGGYRNEKCRKVVDDFIAGKYTFHDKDADKGKSDEETAKQEKREEEGRRKLIETYLPGFDAAAEGSIDITRLTVYMESLSSWAHAKVHLLSTKTDNDGWCSQLQTLSQMCDTLLLLLNTTGDPAAIDSRQLDAWVNAIYEGDSFLQYPPQKGCHMTIDDPAKMADISDRTIWMNFAGSDTARLDCGFLYPSEKSKLTSSGSPLIRLWDEAKEQQYCQLAGQLPFIMTKEKLILVITDYSGGEPTRKHPIMVRLATQIENLNDFIVSPSLHDESTEAVDVVDNRVEDPMIHFDHADLLKWPNYISPTTLDTLVAYPLDYLMEHMLGIVSTGPGKLRDIRTTKGNVAHAVIEHLFAPRGGHPHSSADEIELRIAAEFDKQFRVQTEACGAILYLPENRLDVDLLKEQLRKCLDKLLQILRDNNLVVTGCERKITHDLNLIKKEEKDKKEKGTEEKEKKKWDTIGYIDMTLEDRDHNPVVFDFKWTSSKSHHRNLLLANRSTQLELYRRMLSAECHKEVKRTAYFLMPEGHLYSKENFEGLNCTRLQPANCDNIVEQLRQSFFYRKLQLEKGNVEVSEGMPQEDVGYCKETDTKKLFPLPVDDKGCVSENIFSKYQLFKPERP